MNNEYPQRDIATAEAAMLVLNNTQRVLEDTTSPKKRNISQALAPVFGARWGIRVIRRAASDRMRETLRSLRNSKIGKRHMAETSIPGAKHAEIKLSF